MKFRNGFGQFVADFVAQLAVLLVILVLLAPPVLLGSLLGVVFAGLLLYRNPLERR